MGSCTLLCFSIIIMYSCQYQVDTVSTNNSMQQIIHTKVGTTLQSCQFDLIKNYLFETIQETSTACNRKPNYKPGPPSLPPSLSPSLPSPPYPSLPPLPSLPLPPSLPSLPLPPSLPLIQITSLTLGMIPSCSGSSRDTPSLCKTCQRQFAH